jgi:ribosome-binding protein aMBF1 (putative translation factor)
MESNHEQILDHQDWKDIVVRKKYEKTITNAKKVDNATQKLISVEKKADNDILKHDKITLELRQNIQKGRGSKGLTQKQLANNINMPLQKIQEIESGKAIYNGQDINRIKRFLKIK